MVQSESTGLRKIQIKVAVAKLTSLVLQQPFLWNVYEVYEVCFVYFSGSEASVLFYRSISDWRPVF